MTFPSGERGRWAAALLISLLLHCALIYIFGGAKAEKRPEPVMNVKLVFAPAAAGNNGGGKTAEKKEPQPKKEQAVKPVQKQPEVKKKKEAPVKEISARPAENKEAAADTAVSAPSETAAATDSAGEGSGTGGGGGTGAASGSGTGKGTGSGEVSGIADVNSLEVTHKVLPDYPAFSRKRKEEGTAVIIAAVENGRVQSVEIEKTSGYDRLDNSALRAVKGWRFRHEGRIRVRIPFVFKIR
ncbi:MAG: TonB family protein [Cloacibacillus porcorum]|uniref:energy transducer TonB n=1 Tax=Cloacibacillus porcorum TaxID=1197717 RepID=UPI0023EF591D|nr:energy transducer TonB [Cloacibacillus porcorum]MCD7876168.1 TonB family protein [Cloacibacillus porcorum]